MLIHVRVVPGRVVAGFRVEAVTAGASRQRNIRRQPLIDREPIPHLLDRTRRRQKPRDPDHPVQQREP
ncbi:MULTISPECIES: hypothetical protein, partial [unclassified Microbacterium]|uniref:hypothetical protein n=1 Tax=unclassified Microbacterium TaxID=2609290 RepID=UPI003467A28D